MEREALVPLADRTATIRRQSEHLRKTTSRMITIHSKDTRMAIRMIGINSRIMTDRPLLMAVINIIVIGMTIRIIPGGHLGIMPLH